MTLHAFDILTNQSLRWVALPSEFVDWMANHFGGKLIQHLRQIDPYNDVHISKRVLENPIEEFLDVQMHLKQCLSQRRASGIPERVDIYRNYGTAGALRTINELLGFFEFTSQTACKIVSVGD